MSPDQVYIGRSRVQFEVLCHVLTGPGGIAFGLQNPAEYVLLPEALVLRIELEASLTLIRAPSRSFNFDGPVQSGLRVGRLGDRL